MKTPFLLCVALAASVAVGADWYVAKSGTYVDESGTPHPASTNLVTVLDLNKTSLKNGDTVWVEDGYVADDTSDPVMATDRYKCQVRLCVRRQVMVRSKSGTYDEAKGLGVTVKGAWHSATVPCGTSAIRCMRTENAGTVCMGFVFDGGCGPDNKTYSGGGVEAIAASAFTNCLFRNCYSYQGGGLGGIAGTTCYKCVFTNNVATKSTGGAVWNASCEDCFIADNEAAQGGGISVTAGNAATLRNCQILRNRAWSNSAQSGGGILVDASGACTIDGCRIEDNVAQGGGGGVCGPVTMTNTWVVGNTAGHCPPTEAGNNGLGAGVKGSPGITAVLTDCHVLSNRAISAVNNYAIGGGLHGVRAEKTEIAGNIVEGGCAAADTCVLTDCVITDNLATNDLSTKNQSYCGGIGNSTATNCLIAGNICCMSTGKGSCGGAYNSTLVGCIVSNNTARANGGGVYLTSGSSGSALNCVIVDNTCGDQGGGVWSSLSGATLYNCLIARNVGNSNAGVGGAMGYSYGGTTMPLTLVNCTVTGNDGGKDCASGIGGVRYANLVNTIVWGNVAKNAEYNDTMAGSVFSAKCSTCSVDLSSVGDGNSTADPKLTDDARLKARSPCRGTGYYNAAEMPWAADPNDPRHLDLAGNGRLNGSTIDRGCYAYVPLSGMLLLVR